MRRGKLAGLPTFPQIVKKVFDRYEAWQTNGDIQDPFLGNAIHELEYAISPHQIHGPICQTRETASKAELEALKDLQETYSCFCNKEDYHEYTEADFRAVDDSFADFSEAWKHWLELVPAEPNQTE